MFVLFMGTQILGALGGEFYRKHAEQERQQQRLQDQDSQGPTNEETTPHQLMGEEADAFDVIDGSTDSHPLDSKPKHALEGLDDLESTWVEAMANQNVEVLQGLLTEHYLECTPEGCLGKTGALESIQSSDGPHILDVRRGGRKGMLLGGGVACLAGASEISFTDGDQPKRIPVGHTQVFTRDDGRWQLSLLTFAPLRIDRQALSTPGESEASTSLLPITSADVSEHRDEALDLAPDESLHEVERTVAQASRSGNEEPLDSCFDERLRYVYVSGADAAKSEVLSRLRETDLSEFQIGRLAVVPLTPTHAVVLGTEHLEINGDVSTRATQCFTHVFRRRDDEWHLAFGHDYALAPERSEARPS
jgi:hypothetical protein